MLAVVMFNSGFHCRVI